MKFRLSAVLAATCVALAVPAMAHHSFNTFFDMSKDVKIEGVVTSFRLVSPHSEMMVDVTDASAEAVERFNTVLLECYEAQLAWRMGS